MNSNEQSMHERQAFNELFGDDRFDDSVGDRHRSELRSKMLQAFDQFNREATSVEPHVHPTGSRRHASWNRSPGYAAVLAVCLIGLVTVGLDHWIGPDDRSIVKPQPVPGVTDDAQLFASLAEVNAFRDEDSREALFYAIAICQRGHEGRMLVDSVQP